MKTFAPSDRVQPTSGPYRRAVFEVTSVEGDRVSVQSGNLKLAFRAKLLKFAPKSKVKREPQPTLATPLPPSPFKVGETVSFEQYWNGNRQRFEGTIAKLNEPVGTAIVHFEAPGATGLKELQAPIGVFVKAKTPDDLSEADSIRTEIAKIKASGNLAPDNCWIDWKPQAGNFVQWVWRSDKPMFQAIRGDGLVKTSYIKGADALKEARAAVERRNAVRELEKRLKSLV